MLIASTLVVFSSGCAMTSIFTPYPNQAGLVKKQIESKQISQAIAKLDDKRNSADKILYLMERGRAAQIGNNLKVSLEDYAQVKDAIVLQEQKAVINLSDIAANSLSFITNENAIPYIGEPYEHIFLYHFQAMNYLFDNDLQGALVEVRRANEEQTLALRRHSKELDKLEDEKPQRTAQTAYQKRAFFNAYKPLDSISGRVKNSFQNAYTFYASGVMWEIEGKYNDAYIDYKKALEIFPNNPYLRADVVRLANRLGMREDLARFKTQFKIKKAPLVDNGGELIVFFEQGFAPVKKEIKISIPSRRGIHSVAFSTYQNRWQPTPALALKDASNNQILGTTSPIVYVQALATKALTENLPGLFIRQVLRIVAKKEAAKEIGKQHGDTAQIASILFNVVTERADLRSWLTLPNNAQIFRRTLTAGKRNIRLSSGTASKHIPIQIIAGKKTILRVIGTGRTLHTSAIVL